MAEPAPIPEPWLRGTLAEVDPLRRQILHALELAREDIDRWCSTLSDAQMESSSLGIAPVGFHLRHIARSLDRLLTYAEDRQLSPSQLAALGSELRSTATSAATLDEVRLGIIDAAARIRALDPETFNHTRGVGRRHLPSTIAGLLIHCAEHTQRHVGQAITTSQVVTQGSWSPRSVRGRTKL